MGVIVDGRRTRPVAFDMVIGVMIDEMRMRMKDL